MYMQEVLRQFEGRFEGQKTIIMLTPHYLRGKQHFLCQLNFDCNDSALPSMLMMIQDYKRSSSFPRLCMAMTMTMMVMRTTPTTNVVIAPV